MYYEHKLRLPDDQTLKNRLRLLCNIHKAGVNYDLFWDIIGNRWNDKPTGSMPKDWNIFNPEGWAKFYEKQGFKTNVNQLELVLEYLTSFYSGQSIFMRHSGDLYQANHSSQIDQDDLIIEKIALMALEC